MLFGLIKKKSKCEIDLKYMEKYLGDIILSTREYKNKFTHPIPPLETPDEFNSREAYIEYCGNASTVKTYNDNAAKYNCELTDEIVRNIASLYYSIPVMNVWFNITVDNKNYGVYGWHTLCVRYLFLSQWDNKEIDLNNPTFDIGYIKINDDKIKFLLEE